MDQFVSSPISGDINFLNLLYNLATGFVLSLGIVWHFNKYTRSLTNHSVFSRIFPLLTVTTLLVITIVKSSLALSLGLVGALSIVRFRTPIKDPEELGYIFLSIAVGLGLGADRWLETCAALFVILGSLSVYYRFAERNVSSFLYLVVTIDKNFKSKGDDLWRLIEIIRKSSTSTDMRRLELGPEQVEASFLVKLESDQDISKVSNEIKEIWPQALISLTEQRQNVFA
jgi:hypothetical protein